MTNFASPFSFLASLGQLKPRCRSQSPESAYTQEFYRKHLDSTFLNLTIPTPNLVSPRPVPALLCPIKSINQSRPIR
jgi:hypothetical protein